MSKSSKEEKNPLDDGYYEAEVSSKLEFKNFPFQVDASILLDKRLSGDLKDVDWTYITPKLNPENDPHETWDKVRENWVNTQLK